MKSLKQNIINFHILELNLELIKVLLISVDMSYIINHFSARFQINSAIKIFFNEMQIFLFCFSDILSAFVLSHNEKVVNSLKTQCF